MPEPLRVVFVHGVGHQGPAFAENARQRLRVAAHDAGRQLLSTSAYWAPLADRKQEAFLKAIKEHGSTGGALQELTIRTLSDALYYQGSPTLRRRVMQRLGAAIERVAGHDEPVYVFAHSLGGLIATDWLTANPRHDVRLVTLGCNIPLFAFGSWHPPGVLLSPGRWTNLYHKRDMLGFPLSTDPRLEMVKDVRVPLGGLFRGWTGLSHILYWDDRNLWKNIVPKLIGLKK